MAVVFTWTSYVDTDLAFSEFLNSNHTLTLRYLTPCSKGYKARASQRTARELCGRPGPVLHPAGGSKSRIAAPVYRRRHEDDRHRGRG